MVAYSRTPLVKKLGIKERFKLYVKNPPEDYLDLIDPLPKSVRIIKRLTSDIDMVHFFTYRQSELVKEIPRQLSSIKQSGFIWVSWPKKASKVPTDITEDVIRATILPIGLVDIKVCAVDEVWSGLKLVIRKENRNNA